MKKRAFITLTLPVDLDMVAGPWDKPSDWTDAIQRQFHAAACYSPEITVHEIIEKKYDYVEGQGYVCPEVHTVAGPSAAERLAEDNGGTRGEHHTFTPADWRLDVENHDTRSSYWEWVLSQIEATSCNCDGGGSAGCPQHDEALGSIDHMPDQNSDDAVDETGCPTF